MYTVQPANSSAQNVSKYAELLGLVFKKPHLFTEKYLAWLYRDNPAGPVVGTDAFTDDGQLAAHYATVPVVFMWAGQPVRGLLSLNTATHPAHQGKSLFTRLALATYTVGAQAGYTFVVGVANQNSTHGFLRKLGFAHLGRLEAKVALSAPILPSLEGRLATHRDPANLAWRLANPNTHYRTTAQGIYAPTGIPGLGAAVSGRYTNLRTTLHAPPPATLWLGHVAGRHFKGLSVEIPSLVRPSPLNLIYLQLGPRAVPLTDEICIEALDFDAY